MAVLASLQVVRPAGSCQAIGCEVPRSGWDSACLLWSLRSANSSGTWLCRHSQSRPQEGSGERWTCSAHSAFIQPRTPAHERSCPCSGRVFPLNLSLSGNTLPDNTPTVCCHSNSNASLVDDRKLLSDSGSQTTQVPPHSLSP